MIDPISSSQPPKRDLSAIKSQLEAWGIVVSDSELKVFNNIDSPTKFYRIIGQAERDLLIRGTTITGLRYSDNTLLDITTNPSYGRILREQKYLVTFNESSRFRVANIEQDGEVVVHDVNQDEYYLKNGYSMIDVKSLVPIT